MEDIKIIDNKKYKKADIKSMTVDGNDSGKIIKSESIKDKNKIVVDMVISKPESKADNAKNESNEE